MEERERERGVKIEKKRGNWEMGKKGKTPGDGAYLSSSTVGVM